MTVITVNRVQDIYKNPVYKLETSVENEESKEAKTEQDQENECLRHMNKLLESNRDLDLTHYKDQIFSAVHIGDFVLLDESQKQQ